MCLEFINDLEIYSEDLYDRLSPIILEINFFDNLREFNEEETKLGLEMLQTICDNLLKREDKEYEEAQDMMREALYQILI